MVLPNVFRVYGDIYVKEVGQGSHEGPTRVGACPGEVGVPLYLVATSKLPLRALQVPWIASVPKITFLKVSLHLDSI